MSRRSGSGIGTGDERRPGSGIAADDRAVTPVVEKVLAAGVVGLYVAGVTLAVLGGAVPEQRDAVGDELAERTVAAAAEEVEHAVPPAVGYGAVRARVDLPATIRGSGYRIRVDGRELVLDHPDEAITARARLALPDRVADIDGDWGSGVRAVAIVRVENGTARIELTEAEP